MKNASNTANAIQRLKKMGYTVSEVNGKFLIKRSTWNASYISEDDFRTPRQLIKFAKIFSSENNQNTALLKIVKEMTNSKNRAFTKNVMKTKDEEKIEILPSRKLSKKEDPWCHD
jgi:hypothetical protein